MLQRKQKPGVGGSGREVSRAPAACVWCGCVRGPECACGSECGTHECGACLVCAARVRQHGRWRARPREKVAFLHPDHPRDLLDFTGGTEDKWISQVNKPVLKNLLKKSI